MISGNHITNIVGNCINAMPKIPVISINILFSVNGGQPFPNQSNVNVDTIKYEIVYYTHEHSTYGNYIPYFRQLVESHGWRLIPLLIGWLQTSAASK